MQEIIGSKSDSLKGKLIVLGVCGSIAAVKSFELARELMRHGAKVQPVMSRAALQILGQKAMEFAAGKKPITEISGRVEHVKFFGKGGKAGLLLIAPATANTIGKIAMGIDDTPITTFATTAIGAGKPVLIAPAMHEPMYGHPIVKENLAKLGQMNLVKIVPPLIEEEKAKMNSIEAIVLEVEAALSKKKFEGKKVLIAAGTTKEFLDPIRAISTNASGKTGEELAKEAFRRGAKVTLLHNKEIFFPQIKPAKFETFVELQQQLFEELEKGCDLFFCPAAIGDFESAQNKTKIVSGKKISIELSPREKLISKVRKKFPKLPICGFKAETGIPKKTLEKKCMEFLKKNALQMVVGNDVSKHKMGSDENEAVVVSAKKTVWAKGKKEAIAKKIIEQAEKFL